MEDRTTPVFAVQMTSPAMGVHGDSAGMVVAGALQTRPDLRPNDFGVVYVDAPTPQEAIRQAFVGSVQVQLPGGLTASYSFTPTTTGLMPAEHQPFLIAPVAVAGGEESPPPATAVSDWAIKLEDMASYPASCDWDYNDHSWAVRVTDAEAPGTGVGIISGVVWDDTGSGNNMRDTSDPRLGGVAVGLFNSQGAFLAATATDSAGNYSFSQLAAGSYKVQVIFGPVMEAVVKDYGSDTVDSDVNASGWSDLLGVTDFTDVKADAGAKAKPDNSSDIGVASVKWVQKAGDTGAVLNPDGIDNTNKPYGDRVYPEIKVTQDKRTQAVTVGTVLADKIELQVKLTKAQANVNVQVKLVDVDDPSADKTSDPDGTVDDDRPTTFGNDPNLDIGDNREGVPLAVLPGTTDQTGIATFTIRLPRKPGDNLRAVVSIDPDVDLTKLAGKKNDTKAEAYFVTDGHLGTVVPDPTATAPFRKTVTSKLLTVWRTLHVEQDVLGDPPQSVTFGNGEVKPQDLGNNPYNIPMKIKDSDIKGLVQEIYKPAYITLSTLLSHSSRNVSDTVPFQKYVEPLTTEGNGTVTLGVQPGLSTSPGMRRMFHAPHLPD